MSFATAIRVWRFAPKPGRCSRCHQRVVWVTSADDGHLKPFRPEARPLRTEVDAARQVTLNVFALDAFHRCPKRMP